jgi:DNA segregation ATPase FtsK/SpoIIIE-like protein
MARVRRKARATLRLNLEIAGIAAFGLALYLGLAVAAPERSGALGRALAHDLSFAFGGAAWLVPAVVALLGAIVFLEINVPRLIAKFGGASLLLFLVIDAGRGRNGGVVGTSLRHGLETFVGPAGAFVLLLLIGLSVVVWVTGLSLKKAIGWCILAASRLRAALPTLPRRAAAPKGRSVPAPAAPPGPQNWREAFHLPARSVSPNAAAVVEPALAPERLTPTVAPLERPSPTAASPAPLVPVVPPVKAAKTAPPGDDDVADDDEEYDDEELDDDEELEDDDEELDDEDEFEDELSEEAVAGEYEPAAAAVASSPATAAKAPLAAAVAEPLSAMQGEPARRTYRLPDLALFDPPQKQIVDDSQRSALLEDTLASFGVGGKVTHIERGPAITRYELRPERGVKISRISALADDIALALAATSVRIEAPIPGKSAVGIEVPNAQVSVVAISEILQAIPSRGTVPPLHMALGKDITGRPVFGDLGKMPHLLVAGATGSGKSVCLNCIIASLLVSATPDQVQMLFIDPKRVELTVYNGIPHLIQDVITDARLAAGALHEMTREMDSRYERFAKAGVRKIEEYNAKYPEEKLPYVVIVIDELADLMLIAPAKVETTICRIAQLARATGIHLIVATQRPSVDVITGIIKANIPSRIAFAVSSQIDSRTILDMGGAERLLGRGDMLYLPIDAPKPVRSQGALITGAEVTRLVAFWANQARPDNLLEVDVAPLEDDDKGRNLDPLCYDAAKFIIETNYASTAQLQSQFAIGHPRAVRVMKQLEEVGVVGPHEGTKPRRINLGLGELETIAPRLGRSEQPDLFTQSV